MHIIITQMQYLHIYICFFISLCYLLKPHVLKRHISSFYLFIYFLLESMANTILCRISDFYVLGFYIIWFFLPWQKLWLRGEVTVSPQCQCWLPKQLEDLLLFRPPWGLLWDGNSQPQLEFSNSWEKQKKFKFPKSNWLRLLSSHITNHPLFWRVTLRTLHYVKGNSIRQRTLLHQSLRAQLNTGRKPCDLNFKK